MDIKIHQPELPPEISHRHEDGYSTATVGPTGELTWSAHHDGNTIIANGCPECVEVFPKTVADAMAMAGES
jgi:hypothetical protein